MDSVYASSNLSGSTLDPGVFAVVAAVCWLISGWLSVICLLLILAGWPPVTKLVDQLSEGSGLVEAVAAFSVMTHFEGFQRGVIDSRDLVYFLALIVFSLFTTSVIIRNHRAG